jgi:hypothetical protein
VSFRRGLVSLDRCADVRGSAPQRLLPRLPRLASTGVLPLSLVSRVVPNFFPGVSPGCLMKGVLVMKRRSIGAYQFLFLIAAVAACVFLTPTSLLAGDFDW